MPKRKEQVNKSDLDHLSYLTEKLIKLNGERGKLVDEADEIKAKINKLRLTTIPEYAAEIGEHGVQYWGLGDGSKVEIIEDMKCSIPDTRLLDALKYIKEKDKGSIIKTKISMIFDGEDHEKLDKLRSLLLEQGFIFDEKSVVNAASLKSFLKELRKQGTKDLDNKTFGIHDFKETRIKGVKFVK